MTSVLLLSALSSAAAAEDLQHPVQTETLIQTTSAWDGTPYKAYPTGQPQITVLKITIPAHTALKWHSHPMPNAGYILSGDLTIEKKDGTKRHLWPARPSPRRSIAFTGESRAPSRQR
jgi:quercetin dioxygenase-like cupin family protein